jgi:RNA polymerase-binding transcription factor DksA
VTTKIVATKAATVPAKPVALAAKTAPTKSAAVAKTTVPTLVKAVAAKAAPVVEKTAKVVAKVVAKVTPVVPVITYKCPFPPDELAKWRQILLTRRHEITNDIAGLVKDAIDAEDGHTTPNHLAERGSDADLQDLSLGVAGDEKDIVWQIDRALRKIESSRPLPFGLCEYNKTPIPRTRLQLIPFAPLSIEGATYMEQNSLMMEDMLVEY